MQRREMLRRGVSKAALILPLALWAGGSLWGLLGAAAALGRPREAAAFPPAKRQAGGPNKELIKKEEE